LRSTRALLVGVKKKFEYHEWDDEAREKNGEKQP
jgi:hypothetical protein